MHHIYVIDSHTGGEPTRIVLDGGPDLGDGPLHERLSRLRNDYDTFRSTVVNEPRGSDVLVGGLLCTPHDDTCVAGIIFFNNVGYLGMCGHGTIGLVATLAHVGRIAPGLHRIDTPVGPVEATLHEDGRVGVNNVVSYRHRESVSVEVPEYGTVVGDIAWGGNWFFLVRQGPKEILALDNARHLTDVTLRIMDALAAQGITGAGGAYIDHVELFADPDDDSNHSRNFVMCPGGAYDRSPCGTGTSAKLACLAADGKLAPGAVWNQESITGSVFSCVYEPVPAGVATGVESGVATGDQPRIRPTITGRAFISSEARLVVDPADPLRSGIRS